MNTFLIWFWTGLTIYVIITLFWIKVKDFKARHYSIVERCSKCAHEMRIHHSNGFCLSAYCFCGSVREKETQAAKNNLWEDTKST